jgi:hypothetical protein
MGIVATVPDCRLLLPALMPPLIGPQRVALHSFFRILCEANQLLVNDVVSELSVPLFGASPTRSRRLVKNLKAIDSGSVQSDRLVRFLERATGLGELGSLTLHQLSCLPEVSPLVTGPFRRWCPHCYFDDVSSGMQAYDRLLWSIDLVRVCPVHSAPLESRCRGCGKERAPYLFGRDISGFCPRCRAWLGLRLQGPQAPKDDQARHALWIAQSLAQVLDSPPTQDVDAGQNIRTSVLALAKLHHGGAYASLARQIGRNKSVIATWLAGKARPYWDAVCDISYVYQQPLGQLLCGVVEQIALADPLILPTAARPRQGVRRKSPSTLDPLELEAFMQRVANGAYDSVKSVEQAAKRLGINVRELYRLADAATKAAAKALKARREAGRKKAKQDRKRGILEELERLGCELAASQRPVTRRLLSEAMEQRGRPIRWKESAECLALLNQHVSRWTGFGERPTPATTNNHVQPVSGNS